MQMLIFENQIQLALGLLGNWWTPMGWSFRIGRILGDKMAGSIQDCVMLWAEGNRRGQVESPIAHC